MAFFRNVGKLGLNSMKILLISKNVYSNERFLTTTSRLLAPAVKNASTTANILSNKVGKKDPLDTSFNDPIAAFKSKTTLELIRAYFVYVLCSSEYLVEHNMKVRSTISFYMRIT